MLEIEVNRDEVHFGASVTVRFMRTLRVPDDGREYSLPTLGEFPVYAVRDYAERVPASWRVRPGLFIPMHPHEAMWISMSGRWWKPNAAKVAVGGINALTGEPWHERLTADPQDYLVCPEQQVLSGFKDENGHFRQFAIPFPGKVPVAEPEPGDTEGCNSLQIMVFEPRASLFRDYPPAKGAKRAGGRPRRSTARGEVVMSRQEVAPDPHGAKTWDPLNFGRVCVHVVNAATFREITGRELRHSPIRPSHYSKAGLPWPDVCEDEGQDQDFSDADERRSFRGRL